MHNLICISFHAYSNPRETCLTVKGARQEIWDPDCNSIWTIAYNLFFIAKSYPVFLLRFIKKKKYS